MTIPTHSAGRLASGAALPLRAAGWLAARRALWPLALLPVLLTAVGLVIGAVAAVPLSARLLAALWPEPSGWLAAAWWLSRAAVFVVVVYGGRGAPRRRLRAGDGAALRPRRGSTSRWRGTFTGCARCVPP